MKKISTYISLLFLGMVAQAHGQQFKTINSNALSFYQDNSAKNYTSFLSLQYDSIHIVNGDTTIFPKPILNPLVTTECYSFDTSWAGHKIIIAKNGYDIFFNGNDDSLKIKTQAKLHDQWQWMSRSGGVFKMEVVGTSLENVLGKLDSVKTIKLNLTDNSTTVTEFDSIRISKNYGLIKFYSMPHFPQVVASVTLKGIENTGGIQNLTSEQIYDFNVGDIYDRAGGYIDPKGSNSDEHYRDTILEKTITKDSVKYKISSISTIRENGPNVSNTSLRVSRWVHYTSYPLKDTVLDARPLSVIFTAPKMYYNKYGKSKIVDTLNTKVISEPLASKGDGNCIQPATDYIVTHEYAQGLGDIHSTSCCPRQTDLQLVYFKKGALTWGTPINFDLIITGEKNSSASNTVITLSPQPLADVSILKITSEAYWNYEVSVYSVTGAIIKSYAASTEIPVSIKRADFLPGLYLINMKENSGNQTSLKLVVE